MTKKYIFSDLTVQQLIEIYNMMFRPDFAKKLDILKKKYGLEKYEK